MYCNKCGKELNENSKFCDNCGSKIVEQEANNYSNNKNNSIFRDILWAILIILFGFFVFIRLVQNDGSLRKTTSSIVERNLAHSDYTYYTTQNLSNITVTLTPNVDIRTCSVELIVYDKNNNSLFADTQTKDKLKKESSYTYTFDIGVINNISADQMKLSFFGKVDRI